MFQTGSNAFRARNGRSLFFNAFEVTNNHNSLKYKNRASTNIVNFFRLKIVLCYSCRDFFKSNSCANYLIERALFVTVLTAEKNLRYELASLNFLLTNDMTHYGLQTPNLSLIGREKDSR